MLAELLLECKHEQLELMVPMLAVFMVLVHANHYMSKHSKDIPRTFHAVERNTAVWSAQKKLSDTYGDDIETLPLGQDFFVSIMSRPTLINAITGRVTGPLPYGEIARTLQGVLDFDERSVCRAVANELHVWRTTQDKPPFVGVRFAVDQLEDEFWHGAFAIDKALNISGDWHTPDFELALAWLRNEDIADEINEKSLDIPQEFRLGRLQIAPAKYDPFKQ